MSNDLNQEFNLSNQTSKLQPPTVQQTSQGSFDTVRLVHVVQKSWAWMTLTLFICVILAFFYNRYTKPLFRASSIIQLEFNDDAKLSGLTAKISGGRKQKAKSLSGEIEIIKSNVLYEELLKKINLQVSYYYEGQVINDEKFGSETPFSVSIAPENNSPLYSKPIYVSIKNQYTVNITTDQGSSEEKTREVNFNQQVTVKGFTFSIKPTNSSLNNISAPYFFKIKSKPILLKYLNKNLAVEILNYEANTLAIHFSDYNKKKAKRITEEIIDIYLKKSVEQKQKSNAQTLSYINNQLDSTLRKLEDIEGQMQNLSKGSMFGNTSEAYNLITTQIDKYVTAKNELSDKLELLSHLNKLISNNEELDSFIPQLEGLGTSSLTASITHLNEINQEFLKLRESHKSSTLSYKNKEIERNSTRNTILGYIFENNKILLKKLQEISDKLSQLNSELRKLPSKETDLVGLKRYYGLYENFFLLLNQKKVEFETAKAGKVPDFLILSNPQLDEAPVTINPKLIYIIFVALALFLSFLILVTIFFLENKILNQKELEKITSIPVIGSVPKFKTEKMNYSKLQVIDFPQSRISEAFRNIRSNLEFFCPNKSTRIITVSSTISGEGKTFITLNLAGILALSDKKVIVLDLDMRKPKLHLGFDTNNDEGMSDLLISKNTVSKCIKHSGFKGLDFITAGNKPPNPSELILNKNFDSVLDDLKEIYDIIIIDTPPIGLVTDGISAMQKADIQLYIARAGYTSIPMLKDVELIKRNKQFANMSIILNDVSKGRSYGHSGYGDGYGYYNDEKKTKKA